MVFALGRASTIPGIGMIFFNYFINYHHIIKYHQYFFWINCPTMTGWTNCLISYNGEFRVFVGTSDFFSGFEAGVESVEAPVCLGEKFFSPWSCTTKNRKQVTARVRRFSLPTPKMNSFRNPLNNAYDKNPEWIIPIIRAPISCFGLWFPDFIDWCVFERKRRARAQMSALC